MHLHKLYILANKLKNYSNFLRTVSQTGDKNSAVHHFEITTGNIVIIINSLCA